MALYSLLKIESCIREHHVYKDVWTPVVDKELNCRREEGNISDQYAVATVKSGNIVGHMPYRISAACNLFIQKQGNILCKVTGPRRYSGDLPQGGLEVLCKLTFCGDSKLVTKISTLLRPAKADYKKPTEIKCKAESILIAADQNPCKKLKTDDSEPVSSSVICVDDNTLHTVSPKVWIAFERKVLTEADKDIV